MSERQFTVSALPSREGALPRKNISQTMNRQQQEAIPRNSSVTYLEGHPVDDTPGRFHGHRGKLELRHPQFPWFLFSYLDLSARCPALQVKVAWISPGYNLNDVAS